MSRIALGACPLALLLLTLFLFPPIATMGDLGICLPSPNLWHLPRFAGWLVNSIVILLAVTVMAAANKKYNFIPEASPILSLTLLILLCCNPVATFTVSTSSLLLLCNALCFFVIFSTYEERNATREFFVIATLPAVGAMVQYAFLVMVPVYLCCGFLMKSFRIKEFIAFCFGLLAPYWIAVGLGIVSPFSFRLPDSLIVFSREAVESDIFLSIVAMGVMAILGFIFALYNAVRLFSRNSRLRCMHLAFNFMGVAAVLAAIFDFNNFMAYFGTLALWLAVELATLLNLYNVRHAEWVVAVALALFLPFFILAL